MNQQDTDRDDAGRFAPGNAAGNAGGRPRGISAARRLEQLVQSEGAELFELAFERAKSDDAVLAGLLNLLAAVEMGGSVNRFQQLQLAAQPTPAGH